MSNFEIKELINNDKLDEGLYIFFEDGSRIDFTTNTISANTNFFLNNLSNDGRYTPEKKNKLFEICSVCTAENETFCRAIRPFLAYLDAIDKYKSYEKVVALYKKSNDKMMYIMNTDIQRALRFLSMYSVLKYCSAGHKYYRYFYGLVPIMDSYSFCERLYLNIYWEYKGIKETINAEIEKFKYEMQIMLENLKNKLDAVCNNDAFLNALANFHILTLILSMDFENYLKESVEKYFENINI